MFGVLAVAPHRAMVRAAYHETQAAIPHQVRGWLRAAEAEMAAAAGEEPTCRSALDSAAREIGYGPATEDLPYLALGEAHPDANAAKIRTSAMSRVVTTSSRSSSRARPARRASVEH